ncbi:MAG: hypothetical protein GTO51_01205 [Candidatus Latescibacteria bacterium]|nr:hypothetical protein [Candidatus Latescibacterota bacterium]NIM21617.1 hypothetical protein [Candidatus Latescibacterota bacterium]NIM64596.1 hypothetical protein [Candidatus Latescibacterota bacterium]NIO01111.1 hypothetical protein [Candidatus Latescibacterota bacterium]NIO27504.1 hypothetical protein [Candidatus Latescibacterota bacterium]
MISKRPWATTGVIFVLFVALFSSLANGAATVRDSLDLQQPENVSVRAGFNESNRTFAVFIAWDDIPNTDSTGAFIHPPDTSSWRVETQGPLLSLPSCSGSYEGPVDVTIRVRALDGGQVGSVNDTIRVRYEIQGWEEWNNIVQVGHDYTPNTPIDLLFVNQVTHEIIDLGIQLTFSDGVIDKNGEFAFGCEDFEGFHVWRGVEPDGSDLVIIAEFSKEEAAKGGNPGGSVIDSIYFYEMIPELRQNGSFVLNIPPGFELPFDLSCVGNVIDMPLADNQFGWIDCNAFNGFTYYYAVTTFDRGYNIRAGTQGLQKVESCFPVTGEPFSCSDDLRKLSTNVVPQNDLAQVFAVPNPYRTGGSAFTTPNYHNFPDDKIRFVNVPADCILKIYTVSGDLIWETEHHDAGSGNIEWDARNSSGEDVTSGVYIFKVENPQGEQVYGRLIVIR